MGTTENRLSAVELLLEAGYSRDSIREQHAYAVPLDTGGLSVERVDAASFVSPLPNLDSAAVACVESETADRDRARLRYLGAPWVIDESRGRARLWRLTRSVADEPTTEWAVEERLPDRIKALVAPTAVRALKGGHEDSSVQLSFSHLHHGEWAKTVTEVALAELIEKLVRGVQRRVETEKIPLLVGDLLAAKAACDLGHLVLEAEPDAYVSAARNMASRWPEFPRVEGALLRRALTERTLALLSEISFANLSYDIIGHAYQRALVSNASRRAFGVYYTPRFVAAHLVEECLKVVSSNGEPVKVLDPACGSGSFLIEVIARWRQLPLGNGSQLELEGWDIDPFAVELARLGVFLSVLDLPPFMRPRVQFSVVDAMSHEWPHGAFKMIVTNPPFKAKVKGAIKDMAALFAEKAALAVSPRGAIGMLFPQAFVHGVGYAASRGMLTEGDRRVVSMLFLPEGTFKESRAETVAIVFSHGQKRPVLVREAERVRGTASQLRPRVTYAVAPEGLAGPQEWRVSPFVEQVALIDRQRQKLDDLVDIHAGLQLYDARELLTARRASRRVRFLETAVGMRQFRLPDKPEQYKWLDYESLVRMGGRLSRGEARWFDGAKIVIMATYGHRDPWSLTCAFDESGLYLSDHFLVASLRDRSMSGQALTVILNSSPLTVWMNARARSRRLRVADLRDLPLPPLDRQLVRQLEECHQAMVARPSSAAMEEGDALVGAAYGLSRTLVRKMTGYLEGKRGRPIESA